MSKQTRKAKCEMTSLEDLQVDTRILAAARACKTPFILLAV